MGFGEEIMQEVSFEGFFTQLIWSTVNASVWLFIKCQTMPRQNQTELSEFSKGARSADLWGTIWKNRKMSYLMF